MGVRAASKWDVKPGTAGDSWSAAIPMDFNTWLLSLECWDNNLDVQVSYDGTNFYDAFEVDVDRPLVIPFQIQAIKVKNKDAGLNSRYQVMGAV